MRISKDAKAKTLAKIIAEGEKLFCEKGFENTTIRDIAAHVGIAVGTMFNYFSSKEALVLHLVKQALDKGLEDFRKRCEGDEGLDEEIFLFINSGLRRLRPYRSFLGTVLASGLSPFAKSSSLLEGETICRGHLKVITGIIKKHRPHLIPDALLSQVYWSLYLGILAFWTHDESYNQEQTLALIDYSLQFFSRNLDSDLSEERVYAS